MIDAACGATAVNEFEDEVDESEADEEADDVEIDEEHEVDESELPVTFR